MTFCFEILTPSSLASKGGEEEELFFTSYACMSDSSRFFPTFMLCHRLVKDELWPLFRSEQKYTGVWQVGGWVERFLWLLNLFSFRWLFPFPDCALIDGSCHLFKWTIFIFKTWSIFTFIFRRNTILKMGWMNVFFPVLMRSNNS